MIVGLTGGIGSGKTTVLRMFEKFNIDTYIADDEAKKLMNSSDEIKKNIIKEFGIEAYNEFGLNRRYIASIVFVDGEKLKTLNSIVHPQVALHFKNFTNNSTTPYLIYESAILFENQGHKNCDYIITVTAPIDLRIDRILARDTTTKVDILNRMKNQLSDQEKIEKSDFVINNIVLEDTKSQVASIHQRLLQIARDFEEIS